MHDNLDVNKIFDSHICVTALLHMNYFKAMVGEKDNNARRIKCFKLKSIFFVEILEIKNLLRNI